MPSRSPRVLVIAAFLLGAVFGALGLVIVLGLAVTAALFPMSWLLIERHEDADVRFH